MDSIYKPGAVSSLIHLQTSPTKKSKEQKELDKLFGWTVKSPQVASSNLGENITIDLKSSKKKKKEKSKVDLQSDKKRERSSSKEKKLTAETNENTLKKKQDKIKHVKEKKQNIENSVSPSRKKSKKFKETSHESSGDSQKNIKKIKKRKITLEDANDQNGQDDNEQGKKKKKKLKKKNNINDTEKGISSETRPKITTPPVINDVLCAHKDGLKSRKRSRKDLSDLEDDSDNNGEPIPKRRKKKKRDKSKDFKTVFAGNLPLTITKKQLNKLFSTCGEVESLRIRGAIPANPARGKKYAILKKAYHAKCKSINAYICFVDKESADKACQLMNGKEIEGQHIRVNSSIIDKKVHDHKRSVFVGNLPFAISEEHMRNHFLDCGKISNVRLVRDWKTGIGKGFGYVIFEDVDSADLAVKLDNSKLNNRKIRVFPSEAEPNKRKVDRNHKKDSKNSEKNKVKKNAQKDFVGIKAEKKKKKQKPKHLARKMGLPTKKKDLPVLTPVEKVTKGPNKHMVFE